MVVKLIFVNKLFKEVENPAEVDTASAVLEIDEETEKATLSYSKDAGIVDKRTAQRQAQSICKTGFLLSNSARVGAGTNLIVSVDEQLPDRLLQEGYKYK
ncbi:MAG: hypothetical protein ACXAC7_02200 [Candidatus Hodarchaeales archaeon]